MMNGVHAQAAGAFQVERPVINEEALGRGALGDLEGHAKNQLLGLARSNVTGTEEDKKVPAKMELFNAILVELEGLVINGADEILSSSGELVEDGSGVWKFLGLGEHESCEFLAGKGARAVKQSAVQVFIQGNEAAIEGWEGKIVTILEFIPIQVKGGRGVLPGTAVPAVGQDDSADIPE
jgi:hypothetical protein